MRFAFILRRYLTSWRRLWVGGGCGLEAAVGWFGGDWRRVGSIYGARSISRVYRYSVAVVVLVHEEAFKTVKRQCITGLD